MNAKPSILLICDELDRRYKIAAVLQYEGFIVISAVSLSEGLQLMEKHSFCLVILQMHQPSLRNIEFLFEHKKQWSFPPVLLLFDRQPHFSMVKKIRRTNQFYLADPFATSELLLYISVILCQNHKSTGNSQRIMHEVFSPPSLSVAEMLFSVPRHVVNS